MADDISEREMGDNREVVIGIVDNLKKTHITPVDITEGLRGVIQRSDNPDFDYGLATGLLEPFLDVADLGGATDREGIKGNILDMLKSEKALREQHLQTR